ncbi:MAG: hypothetical protein M3N24_04185 [Actinomycetota bacterium]|nr:hypothetical protein [Actinomycetota bacterium]
MSFPLFAVIFASCAAGMALWIDVRFPSLSPEDLRSAFIRLVAGVAIVHLSLLAVSHLIRPLPPITEAAVMLTVGFVLLTIALLTAIWVIKVAQRMMGGSVR